jgi:hypothetical protein
MVRIAKIIANDITERHAKVEHAESEEVRMGCSHGHGKLRRGGDREHQEKGNRQAAQAKSSKDKYSKRA